MSAAVVTEVKGDKQLEPESFALLNLLLDLLPGLAVTEPACCGNMKCGGSKVLKTEAHFVHMGNIYLLSQPVRPPGRGTHPAAQPGHQAGSGEPRPRCI